jgi:hypothetical protein
VSSSGRARPLAATKVPLAATAATASAPRTAYVLDEGDCVVRLAQLLGDGDAPTAIFSDEVIFLTPQLKPVGAS